MDEERLQRVFAAIDAVNAEDPHRVEVDGRQQPAELIYGRRITETLHRMVAEPSEPMRIAARGQHVGRWRLARKSYPEGRAGYLAWRRQQRVNQAERLGQIMAAEGYRADDIARVGTLIRKENMHTDAEVQTFEDVICVMFFEHYLRDFVSRVGEEKLAEILVKTWGRMSPPGRRYALMLDLPDIVTRLMQRELGDLHEAVTRKTLIRSA
jgi:hypothetical protein